MLASMACGGFHSVWQSMGFVLFWGILMRISKFLKKTVTFWGLGGTKYMNNCSLIKEKSGILRQKLPVLQVLQSKKAPEQPSSAGPFV